jgi:hypothetical protein
MIVRVHLRVQQLLRLTFNRAALANALPQTSNLPTKKQHRRCVVVVVAACMRGHARVFLIDIAGSVIERVKLQGPPAQGSLFALGCVALCSFWRANVPPAHCVARSSRSAPTFRLSTEVAHAFVFPPFLGRCNPFPFTSMLAATFSLHTHALPSSGRGRGGVYKPRGRGGFGFRGGFRGRCAACVGVRVLALAPRGLSRAVCGVAAALRLHLFLHFCFFIFARGSSRCAQGRIQGRPSWTRPWSLTRADALQSRIEHARVVL